MTRPIVPETAEEAFAGLMPWNAADESVGWHLLALVAAATRSLDNLNQLVRDGDHPGWSRVFDLDRAQTSELPWIGQFLGVEVDATLSGADQRQQIRQTQGYKRGTPAAMVAAAQPHLTGTKAVTILERDTSAYHLTVHTFTAETPDSAAVLAALLTEKPAGLVMNYEVIDGLTYDEIAASGKTYDELTAEFPTSDSMKFAQSV